MKIWVIGRSYPLQKNHLRGTFELEQAMLLAERGHRVTYIACVFHHRDYVKKWGYAAWKE